MTTDTYQMAGAKWGTATMQNDPVLTAAVTRWTEIIGEAATNVSEELKAAHPEVPWPRMIGMRNRLIHAYPTVDLDLLWGVITKHLPVLRAQIAATLAEQS